jgi:1,2-diacylglycerol 3-alpha-glucosyltransferase
MAPNSAPPSRKKFRDVNDSQGVHGLWDPTSASAVRGLENPPANQLRGRNPRRARLFSVRSGESQEHPFRALFARQGRPMRVAILSDFTKISYANGAAFQTRFLYQELKRCGHEVTIIGPRDPSSTPDELAPGTVELPSMAVKMYPGLYLPLPLESWVSDASRWDFDLVFAQTTSLLLEFGLWLRKMRGIPLLCVNTTHLVAAYDVLLPERLSKIELVHTLLHAGLRRPYEQYFSSLYNQSDGLVVLSDGLRTYWRERGVQAPIHVVPRAVQPDLFDRPLGDDPWQPLVTTHGETMNGPRLLCAGRHTREKAQDRVIRIFATHVVPQHPNATLTLLGQGPDTEFYKRVAADLGVAERVLFPGEVPFSTMVDYYNYADVFVHASLSETYGNVMGEALWCGTPTVAFADGMGVSAQIQNKVNGLLLSPGKNPADEAYADAAFGRAVCDLLGDESYRAQIGHMAAKAARERAAPEVVARKMSDAFLSAQEHIKRSGLRPAVEGPKPLQLWETFRHFRRWAFYNGAAVAVSHIRKPYETRETSHPQIKFDASDRSTKAR